MRHIGKNIKRIRIKKKMTIADLANEHISAGMISLIENNKTKPSVERLQHIAKNLGVPIHDLWPNTLEKNYKRRLLLLRKR